MKRIPTAICEDCGRPADGKVAIYWHKNLRAALCSHCIHQPSQAFVELRKAQIRAGRIQDFVLH